MSAADRPDADRIPALASDRGSVTPLIIGMVLLLLILGFGVTAAGSAFLAGQNLQSLCDGAAARAADAIPLGADPTHAATDYLNTHGAAVTATVRVEAGQAHLTCDTDAPLPFGRLFGSPTIHRHTTAASLPAFRD